jgi:hypothetical protein
MLLPNRFEINSAFAEESRELSVNALRKPTDELKTVSAENKSFAN